MLECWSIRKSSKKTYMVGMLLHESYIIWNFIIYCYLFYLHGIIVIDRFFMCLFMFLQKKWHQYLKKRKWKMSPCINPQNMIRLIMVFKSPGVYFTAALWCCSSRKFSFFFHHRWQLYTLLSYMYFYIYLLIPVNSLVVSVDGFQLCTAFMWCEFNSRR